MIYYSADNIWILGRRQNKTGTEVTGYDFVINVEKSRYVKEKSKIPISVSWDAGIEKYSGLMDLALALGFIVKSGSWYQLVDMTTGEVEQKKLRANQIGDDFYDQLIQNEKFKDAIKQQYTIGYKSSLSEDFLEEIDLQEA